MRERLSAQQVRNAQAREKVFYLSDGGGLLLEVRPNGAKYWILRLQRNGKETRRGLGSFPSVSLKEARELADEKRANPETQRHSKLCASFAAVADAYSRDAAKRLAENTVVRNEKLLRCHILPALGSIPLDAVTADDIRAMCQKIVRSELYNTAVKCKGVVSQIFKFAVDERLVSHNPALDVNLRLSGYKEKHYAAVTGAAEIGALMRAIGGYSNFIVRNAMLFSALTFCRPSEIAHAEWCEVDADRRAWIIPAEKMKTRQPHYVPLSRQAFALLEELLEWRGKDESRYVFPSVRSRERCISSESVRAGLRVIGFDNTQMTAHGFRAMASTVLNEYNWDGDVIELQLAHGERNAVRRAYNRAQHIEERTAMMQWYADYLDAVRDGLPVPPKPKITITL